MFRKVWLPKGFEFLSGLPEATRRRWWILTLQAYFDDSGDKGQGQFMAMAGLFGPVELLASLANEWEKHLRAAHPGRIRYFKLDEALGLNGEFRDWKREKADEKIRQMARVIDRSDIHCIAIVLDLHAFERVFGHWEDDPAFFRYPYKWFRHPYLTLCESALAASVTLAVELKATTPIDIVYDKKDKFEKKFAAAFDLFVASESASPERGAVMPIQPMFRDDKDFVLLQAADLLAGDARLHYFGKDDFDRLAARYCRRQWLYYHELNEERMREIDSGISRQ